MNKLTVVLLFAHSFVWAQNSTPCITDSGRAQHTGLKTWCWQDVDAFPYNGDSGWPELNTGNECDSTSVTIVGDNLRFYVDPKWPKTEDVAGCVRDFNIRGELSTRKWPVEHKRGTEEWFGWSYRFGDDYLIDEEHGWLLFQVHNGDVTKSPQISLNIADSGAVASHGASLGEVLVVNKCNIIVEEETADYTPTGIIPKAGDVLNIVVNAVWNLKEDQDPTRKKGFLQVWINGVSVYEKQVSTIYEIDATTTGLYGGNAKWGIYKWRWADQPNVQASADQGIVHLETYMSNLRMFTDTVPYLNPQNPYDLVNPQINVTGVEIKSSSLILESGGTGTLKASVLPWYATEQGISWSSSDSNVATIDSNGRVTAISLGTTTLTATTVAGGYQTSIPVTVVAGNGNCQASGTVLMERYDNISGNEILDLTNAPSFPDNPNSLEELTAFEIPSNAGDDYGARIRGYLCPPETGTYHFWIAGDNYSELFLSPDDTEQNKAMIANVHGYTNYRQWNRYGSQRSVPVQLVRGERYYVEALFKEGVGGDHMSVGWRKPSDGLGQIPTEVIPGDVLSPSIPDICDSLTPIAGYTPSRIKVSGHDGNGPCNLMDDNLNTRWSAEGDGEWAELDLGSIQNFNQVSIAFFRGDIRNAYFDLQVSNDGVNWSTIMANASSSGTTLDLEQFNFSEQNSRYLRYVGHGNSLNMWNSLQEITVNSLDCTASGAILMERYDGIPGNYITDLTNDSSYPNSPSQVSELLLFEIPSNASEEYGARISGYLCAPETGSYQFWISGDNYSELYLSGDVSPSNKNLIAYVHGYTGYRSWNVYPDQQSNTIALVAGNQYYIEVLFKEGVGGDHMSVGWRRPSDGTGGAPTEVIPGSVLSPRAANTDITAKAGANLSLETTATTTGDVGQTSDGDLLRFFPNPTSGQVIINGIDGRKNIHIWDVSGTNIYHKETTESAPILHFDNYAKGIYFVKIEVDGKTVEHFKVVKN